MTPDFPRDESVNQSRNTVVHTLPMHCLRMLQTLKSARENIGTGKWVLPNTHISQSLTWPTARTSTSHYLDPQHTHESVIILSHNTHINQSLTWPTAHTSTSHLLDPQQAHQSLSWPTTHTHQSLSQSSSWPTIHTPVSHYQYALTHNAYIHQSLSWPTTHTSVIILDPQNTSSSHHLDDPQHTSIIYCWPTTHTCTHRYMTHSQNLNRANGLMFAHAKSKPTIMLCISILFYCVVHSINKYMW